MDFPWAVNKIKLQAVILDVRTRNKIDPRVQIDEATIKEEYIRRAGLVREDVSTEVGTEESGPIAPRSRGRRSNQAE